MVEDVRNSVNSACGRCLSERMQIHDVTGDDPQPTLVNDVTDKVEAIREALKKIGSSLYKLDDMMHCLGSCR
jgi:bacterioferritin-associated ferredoxin